MADETDPIKKLEDIASDENTPETVADLAQAVMKINAKIGTHIGNPNAHLIIDPNNAALDGIGYMSKAGFVPKYVANAAVGIPKSVASVDPTSLNPGLYKGYSLSNLPDPVTALGEKSWFIRIFGKKSDDLQSLDMTGQTHGSHVQALKYQGSWYWDAVDRDKQFIPDQPDSTYSVVTLGTKKLVEISLNLTATIPDEHFAKVYAHMSASLLPKDKMPFNGYVETDKGTFGTCYGMFSSDTTITIWNRSGQNASKLHAHFVYTLNK